MITLTREYLATYTYLESEIKRIRRRIKHYEEHPIQTEYGIVKGSMQRFPFTECNFVVTGVRPKKNEQREQQIRQLIVALKANEQIFEGMRLDIECFIENLPPEEAEVRTILGMRYVERMSEEQIGAELGFHRSSIGKKIDGFLKRQESAK